MDIDLRDEHRPRFGLRVLLLVIAALAILSAVTLPPLVGHLQRREQAFRRIGKLRTVSLAIHAYEGQHGAFPPSFITDHEGNPILSWRVQILPYLGHESLFRQFHLDEPWNSPHNINLVDKMPECYRDSQTRDSKFTTYQAITGSGTIWSSDTLRTRSDLSNPSLPWLVESERPVIWTKPEDLSAVDLANEIQQAEQPTTLVCTDNTVVQVSQGMDPIVLQRLIPVRK